MATKRSSRSDNGSALIEASFVLFCAITAVTTLLFYIYYVFCIIWLNHLTYEFLICLEEGNIVSRCEKKFNDARSSVLPWGQLMFFHYTTQPLKANVEYQISNKKIRLSKQLYMPNEKGFVVTSLLALWPLFFSILIIIATGAFYLKARAHTLHKCRQSLLVIQDNMGKALEKLQELNPQAKHLREEEETVNQEILEAIAQPELLPPLEARLAAIKLQQLRLHSKQLLIIEKVETSSKIKLVATEQEIKEITGSTTQIKSSTPKLAVVAVPASSLSPNYERVPFFSTAQKISSNWSARASSFIGSSISRWLLFVFPQAPSLELTCSATLKEENAVWKSKLAKDKS